MPRRTYTTTLMRAASMCFIPVPFDPAPIFGRVRAPVVVTIARHSYRSTISTKNGRWCVPLRRSNREAAGLEGDETVRVTLELDEAFGNPELVASGLLMPFVRSQLGADCVMTTYTAVISLPGAKDQLMHKDFSPLFAEKGWKFKIPCWSLQAIVPLVPLNEATGGTAIWKGTQRLGKRRSRESADVHVPQVPLGSVLLVDYKTAHAGRANNSGQVRPIVCLAYARPWFRDSINHRRQPPLRFQSTYAATAPKKVLDLVGWWDRDRELAQADL